MHPFSVIYSDPTRQHSGEVLARILAQALANREGRSQMIYHADAHGRHKESWLIGEWSIIESYVRNHREPHKPSANINPMEQGEQANNLLAALSAAVSTERSMLGFRHCYIRTMEAAKTFDIVIYSLEKHER